MTTFAFLVFTHVSSCCLTADVDAPPDPRLQAVIRNLRQQTRRLSHHTHTANPPRHSSVHLNYPIRVSGDASSWYNEVKVLNSSESSYFAVNGHAYGYAGIQEVKEQPFEGRVMFSIWDQLCTGDDPAACPEDKQVEVTQCGVNVTCVRFGGEGTGCKAQWEWNDWKRGESYAFLTIAAPRPSDRVEYTGYFYAPSFGWKALASMIVNRAGKDWALNGLFSFVEQWTAAEVEDLRWAEYGPTLLRMDGEPLHEWIPMTQATWSHGTAAHEEQVHIDGEVTKSGDHWAMGLGGDLVNETSNGATLTINFPQACPIPLVSYLSLETQNALPTGGPLVSGVTCGNHYAPTCAECTDNNGKDMGSSWCNGECIWQNEQCEAKGRRLGNATCGNRHSETCAVCPPSVYLSHAVWPSSFMALLIQAWVVWQILYA